MEMEIAIENEANISNREKQKSASANRGFIITQTPFRISFFGGGTDFPDYFNQHRGQVLGTTIDKYIYVTLNSLTRFYEPRIRLSYSKLECVNSPMDLRHDICRVILEGSEFFSEDAFVDIHTFADLPASSGVGSSSAFTVGMLNAMYLLHGRYLSSEKIAREAINIEREKLKDIGGWQDQYFSAFGGFNRIIFEKTGSVTVEPISIDRRKIHALEQSCYMVFTANTRSSSEIQKHFKELTDEKIKLLDQTKSFVDEAMHILYNSRSSDMMLKDFGALLHHAWEVKRKLSPNISAEQIDQIYETAINAGAYGGKICGAGGGGFIVLICSESNIAKVKAALPNYHIIKAAFENAGSRSLYNKF